MTNQLFLTSKELLSVSFNIEAGKSASVVDGRVLRQSVLYKPNLPRTQALLKVYYSLCSLCPLWLNIFQKPPRRLSGGNINQKTKEMQNKPNLRVFWAVSGDYEEKQTQTNPIQTQNKPNSSLSAAPQSQNKPNFLDAFARGIYHFPTN